MNYLKIEEYDIANGLGVRVSLWVSGCQIRCPGCHNPESWDFNNGKPFDKKAKAKLFEYLSRAEIQGITITGGNPIEFRNVSEVYALVKEIKNKFPEKDIWLYSGYPLEYIDFVDERIEMSPLDDVTRILKLCDVVVDGPYVKGMRDISLPFRGSSNQRIIDVKKTLKQKEIILLDI